MIKIGICDDEKIYSEEIGSYISDILKKSGVEAKIYKYTDPKALLDEAREKPFDVLFLDIDMPLLSGFDISRIVREISPRSYIIFISAKRELVYNSFEYNPFYFICKAAKDELYRELSHVIKKLLVHYQQHRKVTVNDTSNGITVIRLQDIIYIKSEKHYLQYFVAERSEPYVERSTIAKKESELACPDFMKPHLRYLVNMNHISKFGGLINTVLMDNGEKIPIGRTFKESAMQAYMVFKRR